VIDVFIEDLFVQAFQRKFEFPGFDLCNVQIHEFGKNFSFKQTDQQMRCLQVALEDLGRQAELQELPLPLLLLLTAALGE